MLANLQEKTNKERKHIGWVGRNRKESMEMETNTRAMVNRKCKKDYYDSTTEINSEITTKEEKRIPTIVLKQGQSKRKIWCSK